MVILKNILVATDFSEPSSVALAYGRELATSYRATLHVLHVVENVMVHYSPEIGLTSPVLQEKIEAVAQRDLEKLISAVTGGRSMSSCSYSGVRLLRADSRTMPERSLLTWWSSALMDAAAFSVC